MSFTLFPRQSTLGNSDWNQWMTSMSGTTDKVDDALLSTRRTTKATMPIDNGRKIADSHQTALTTPLPQLRRSARADQTDHDNPTAQPHQLKSSLRQTKSTTLAPCQQRGGKSVKFDPLHLEKICLFEESQSPNETPSFDRLQYPIFKVEYSQWPIVTLFKHQQNVQLKRSLKIQQDGSLLHGQVVVRNLGYEKVVEIRYTLDGWQTVSNTQASYIHGRGSMDMFVFDLDLQQGMADRGHLRVTIDMAVRYTVRVSDTDYIARQNEHHHHNEEATFWDNNDGHNYQVQIVEAAIKRSVVTPALASKTGSHTAIDEAKDTIDPPTRKFRYNFNSSLLDAKLHNPPPSLSAPPSPPLSPSLAAALDPVSDPISNPSRTSNTSSSPSSLSYLITGSDQASLPDDERPTALFSCANDNHPLTSPSYSDLVNKYCFYGSQ
ncbi:hypothetical protein [Absidia glauca]|uniref:CBM21 domain-containing protein n=1 Tax=Absidia glauca TaxID=4829 RepID=A0A163TJL9_ABSGL|nr:hypothetical protein [Absidia glauca]